MIKALWLAIKRLLGFPMPPSDEQKTEQLITMREKRDCAVAAVATACRVTYEAAHKALCHWDLPFFLESPLLSNPLNILRAVRSLGFEPDDKARISELLRNELIPGKVICLVHNPDGGGQRHLAAALGGLHGSYHSPGRRLSIPLGRWPDFENTETAGDNRYAHCWVAELYYPGKT